jgi:hypothetical protein
MILAPNIACIAGVFTMGFGIMTSVLTNNVAALGALANGVLPLRKVAQLEAERRHRLEMTQTCARGRDPGPTPPGHPEAAVNGKDQGPPPPNAPEQPAALNGKDHGPPLAQAPEPPEAAELGQDHGPAPSQAPERRARRWKETVYRRRLRRPIDETTRQAISDEFSRRRHQIPVPAELHWHREKPQLTIDSKGFSFIVNFTREDLVVDAELSLAARMLATSKHREDAVKMIESVANDLGL